MLQGALGYLGICALEEVWIGASGAKEDEDASQQASYSNNTQNLLHSPSLSAAVGLVEASGVQCVSSGSGSCSSGLPSRAMEESSCCQISLAVDCRLSLGSATAGPDIPARLSRAASPAQDLMWSLSVRSEQDDAPTRRTCEQERSEQGISWGGSCGRSEPNVVPEYFSQQAAGSDREVRGCAGMPRSGLKGWSRSGVRSPKEEIHSSKGFLGMLDNHAYESRSSRQSWLPPFLSSNEAAAESRGVSRGDRCTLEGSNFVRVCAHCGTSKTPLWRNGPQGPKSLCNACGIRFKKAGRRSAANGSLELESCSPGVVTAAKVGKRKLGGHMEEDYWDYPSDSRSKKRSRGTFLRPEESLLSGGSCMTWQSCLVTSSPHTPGKRDRHPTPLPRSQEKKVLQMSSSLSPDEEEGAQLLMALSLGLVYA